MAVLVADGGTTAACLYAVADIPVACRVHGGADGQERPVWDYKYRKGSGA